MAAKNSYTVKYKKAWYLPWRRIKDVVEDGIMSEQNKRHFTTIVGDRLELSNDYDFFFDRQRGVAMDAIAKDRAHADMKGREY